MQIGLVAEGPTDAPVIENIVYGFLRGSHQFELIRLPPPEERLGDHGIVKPTNWTTVFAYLAREDFRNAFRQLDYVVVQIDTDVSQEVGFDVPRPITESGSLDVRKFIASVKARLIQVMGPEFYEAMANQIIFAIAVDSIECWLLPLLYDDKRVAKTTNCRDSADQELFRQKQYVLNKDYRNYARASKPYQKQKELMSHGVLSPSLPFFLAELTKLNTTSAP